MELFIFAFYFLSSQTAGACLINITLQEKINATKPVTAACTLLWNPLFFVPSVPRNNSGEKFNLWSQPKTSTLFLGNTFVCCF